MQKGWPLDRMEGSQRMRSGTRLSPPTVVPSMPRMISKPERAVQRPKYLFSYPVLEPSADEASIGTLFTVRLIFLRTTKTRLAGRVL